MQSVKIKFYLVLISFLFFALSVIIIRIVYVFKKSEPGIILKPATVLAVVILLVVVDLFFIEPNWISTERVRIYDPELAAALGGLKVVQISDIHLKETGFRERQLVEDVNALKPDLLFITGDFFSNSKGPEAASQLKEIIELIKGLKASVGIYGILGNYDTYLQGHPDRLAEMKAAGIDIIDNEVRSLSLPNNKLLWLANCYDSLGDMETRYDKNSYEKLKMTLEKIPPGSAVILLSHYPDIFAKAFNLGIGLVLAGHTHGGQLRIPVLMNLSNTANKSRYIRGLYDAGKTKLYVNRGIGTSKIPGRFLCRPEITVFDFVSKPGP